MQSEPDDLAPTTTIRRFQPSDAAGIAEIILESPEAAAWTKEGLASFGTFSGALVFVCHGNPHVSAFLEMRQVLDEAEVLNIAVRRSKRRRGLARMLLQAAFDQLRQNGVARVFLEVRESNLPAIQLYQKCGFTKIGRRTPYYANPAEAAICMEKILTA
jgi:ribosomal-protein-alanine N-acetyltransferase